MILSFTENLQWFLKAFRNKSKTLSMSLQALHDLTGLFFLSYHTFTTFVWSHFEILIGFIAFHPSWELCHALCPTVPHWNSWNRVDTSLRQLPSLLCPPTCSHTYLFLEIPWNDTTLPTTRSLKVSFTMSAEDCKHQNTDETWLIQ